jgi:hypothetical protein
MAASKLIGNHDVICETGTKPPRWVSRERLIRSGLLFVILAVGAWLRFDGLGNKSLWLDESLSWRLSTFPVPELIARTGSKGTVHPPCYFVVLRGWSWLIGDSEVSLRSLAALCGVATIAAMYWTIRAGGRLDNDCDDVVPFASPEHLRYRGAPTVIARNEFGALLAAALVALNAQHIHASKQVRMYSMAALLLLLGTYMLFVALAARHHRWLPWAAFATVALAACYTHYFAAVSVGAQMLFAVGYLVVRFARTSVAISPLAPDPATANEIRPNAIGSATSVVADGQNALRAQLRCAAVVAIVLIVCYLPWLSSVARHSTTFRTTFPNATTAQTVFINIYEAVLGTPADVTSASTTEGVIAGVALLAVLAFLAFSRSVLGGFLVITGTCPALVSIVYSLFSDRSAFYSRYLSFAQLSWLAGIALVCQRIRCWPERWLVTALSIGWGIYSCWASWPIIGPAAEAGMRAAVQCIFTQREASEPVLVESPFAYFGVRYYARHYTSMPLLCSKTGRPESWIREAWRAAFLLSRAS